MSDRIPPLTDLERRTFKVMLSAHQRHKPGVEPDYRILAIMAKSAVSAMTKGTGPGRRVSVAERRIPDPGCTPERIRALARTIEGSYHTMPNGWVSAEDLKKR